MMTPSLAYRKAALQHASTVGLVIALCDTLIGNLCRAAAALERNDIQGRCAELVHGFNVLQQLELMVDMQNGGETAIRLRRFYAYLRNQMLAAQFKLAPDILYELVKSLIKVREAWQQVDARGAKPMPAFQASAQASTPQDANMLGQPAVESEMQRLSFSCSG
jgi:flagellar protein FliS